VEDLEALRCLMLESPSRFEMYGEDIFKLLKEEHP